MNSQSRHDAPSVTPALKISVGFGVLSIKVFESNFQFWSSPLSIPNCTQQFLWTLQFNVALPDLVNFMSIASSFETQSPPREGLGAAAKNNSSAVKYAIKRYFFFRDAMMLQRKTWPSQKKIPPCRGLIGTCVDLKKTKGHQLVTTAPKKVYCYSMINWFNQLSW